MLISEYSIGPCAYRQHRSGLVNLRQSLDQLEWIIVGTMTTKEQINQDLKQAMKAKDDAKRDTLRGVMAALRQVEVDEQKTLSEDDITSILMSEAKKRREAIEAFEAGGRADEAERERQELSLIESYLPAQLSRDELTAIIQATIADVGASSPQDMGKVMGAVMPKVRGQADGRLVNQLVRELLK